MLMYWLSASMNKVLNTIKKEEEGGGGQGVKGGVRRKIRKIGSK